MIDFIILYWFEVLLFLIAAIPSIILFCIKGRISHWFAKELETHRVELDRKSREIQLGFDLQLDKLHIEYGSLYEKRVTAIEKIYHQLFALQLMLRNYPLSQYSNSEEEVEFCSNYLNNIIGLIDKLKGSIGFNLIYFPKEDATNLEEINSILSTFKNKYDIYDHSIDQENCGDPDMQTQYFLFQNKELLCSEKIQTLLPIIIERFRNLIGITGNE